MICYRGLIVDIIRRLWDRGLYQDNKWLKMCHDYWFDYWLNYRTAMTMKDVDRQIDDLQEDPSIADPLYWEEGDTIGFSYEFADDNT